MHIQLVLAFWVHDQLVNLVSFYLFVLYQEVVHNLNSTKLNRDPPNVYLTVAVCNEQPPIIVEHHSVRMLVFHQILITRVELIIG